MPKVLLTDLNEVFQKQWLAVWRKEGRDDLLEAYYNGKDIVIGKYSKPKVVKE